MTTDSLIITNFTDPVCTWCWGIEPVFRKLETHFPGQIEFRYVMGGLVENINHFRDAHNDIGGVRMEQTNQQIITHWLEAAQRHGMPVQSENFALFSPEAPSTYPQNIACKAAQISDPDKADLYLRRLREASAAEARPTTRKDVLVSLAGETGLDLPRFIQALRDGSAEAAFRQDLDLTRSLGVRGFPTFIVAHGNDQIMLRGYNTFETFVSVIDMATKGRLKPHPPECTDQALLAFLDRHPRLAAEEIRMAFNIDDLQAVETWMKQLADEGEVFIGPAGTSYFVARKKAGHAYCNLERGYADKTLDFLAGYPYTGFRPASDIQQRLTL